MTKKLEKMKIAIKDCPDKDDEFFENIWVQKIEDNLYEIDNIPFYAYGISLGDICSANKNIEGEIVFESVIKKSGHSTLRLFIKEANFIESPDYKQLLHLGCSVETVSPKYICIDVPNNKATLVGAVNILKKGEEKGFWQYEEADLFT